MSNDYHSKLPSRWPSFAFVLQKPSPMGWARQMSGPLARSAETFIDSLFLRRKSTLLDELD